MEHRKSNAQSSVQHLKPCEPFGADIRALSPFSLVNDGFEASDAVCTGLEELSRHLRWLDDDYRSDRFDRLGARVRGIILLADQLGLRRVGQVAADVVYCLDDPENVALAATLSRLMRLISQALDHAGGSVVDY